MSAKQDISKECTDGTAKFALPVDSEHKATVIRLWSFARPHMFSFQLNWLAFLSTFLCTFAPAALLPVIRNDIDLTRTDLGNAGIASVIGAVAMRVLMGNFVDTYGPRYGYSTVLLLTVPAIYSLALVKDAAGFIIVRLFIGFSLASFVCCQFWCTSMFNTKVVGTANAIAAGSGNAGSGVAAFIMPLIYEGIHRYTPAFVAWRWSFFVPASFQLLLGIVILLFAQDLPDGNYRDLKASGSKMEDRGWRPLKAAVLNYRTWVLCLTYGYCFGVELTVVNIITTYMYDQFDLSLRVAGLLGSIFGLANFITRATGGIISDVSSKYWGMRGRIWSMWLIQTLGGVFCLVMGLTSNSLTITLVVLVLFSIFCQQSAGLSCGIAPFVSKRSTGLVFGFVGAGGNAGAATTQAIFFTYSKMSTAEGFFWMGVMTIAVTALYTTLYFPMWGGFFTKAKPGVTEEDYYLSEYTAEEKAKGMHTASLKFAYESRSQRGLLLAKQDPGQVSVEAVGGGLRA